MINCLGEYEKKLTSLLHLSILRYHKNGYNIFHERIQADFSPSHDYLSSRGKKHSIHLRWENKKQNELNEKLFIDFSDIGLESQSIHKNK